MYNSARTRHHGAKRAGDRVSRRSSGVHQRKPDSDFRARGKKLQGSIWRRSCARFRTFKRAERLCETAQVYERCLWCATKFTGCETLETFICGEKALCEECRAMLVQWKKPSVFARRKKGRLRFVKPVHIVFEHTQQAERMLGRVLRYGDLEAAKGFLDGQKDCLTLLRKYPAALADGQFECPEEIFKAFFGAELLERQRRLSMRALKAGQRGGSDFSYAAVSFFGLSQTKLNDFLHDPNCAGIWILMQKREEISA